MQAAVCAYLCISLYSQVDRSDEYITNYAQNPCPGTSIYASLKFNPPCQLTSSMCLSGKTYLARENEHENLQ